MEGVVEEKKQTEWMTVREKAAQLGLSLETIRRWVKAGKFDRVVRASRYSPPLIHRDSLPIIPRKEGT